MEGEEGKRKRKDEGEEEKRNREWKVTERKGDLIIGNNRRK